MKTTILTLASLALAATAHGRDLHLHQCPAAVQGTIESNARGGVIEEVDLISIEGSEIYIAEVELPRDLDLKVYVSGNGTLLKTREDVPLRSMPTFIRDAVRGHGGTIDDVEKETAGGKVTWHVEIDRKGIPDMDVVLNAEGGVISEIEDHDD
ncbi:hypothetical protein OKA05_07520 [Luteolibacter arcticus]|uniref:PepSY domain-containing protein n=1 Tax=Luteolibacter arcticus TaxID=1581411 RepID=A0ABT3GGK2_9BACT|nr:hypothetical protein [Luteolibacter arcticus]MCW1922398.1 hypothetical protein [Luteolibacter arcticus]